MQQSKVKWVRLGDYIVECDERNSDNNNYPVLGINKSKDFMPTVANMDGIDTKKYKVVRNDRFVFSGMQTGRDECIRISIYQDEEPALISPAYMTFSIDENKGLLSEYLFLYFNREEMDRYGAFISDSSVRANLDWPRFLDISIPLPSKAKQQELVNAWKGLRTMKAENEDLSEPLMQLCQSYLQDLKKRYKMVEIGPFIEECNERNSDGKYGIPNLRGVTSEGVFDDTKANTDGLKFNNYKIVKKDSFAYNPSRINIGSIAKSEEEVSIISPMYVVFKIRDGYKKQLNSDFMNLWFKRSEFQRSTLFFATGSVRDTFDYDEMRRVRIPLPPIEIQQAIVNIYQCAKEAKEIAKEADELSKGICSALVRSAVN